MNKILKEQKKMFAEIENLFGKGNINEIGFARCIWLMLYNNYITSVTIMEEEISEAEIAYFLDYGCQVIRKNDEIVVTL